MRYASLFLSVLLACSSSSDASLAKAGGKADDPAAALPHRVPKRVIWLIGDGMGVAQISAAAYAKGEPLAMLTMPELAYIATHEHEFATTDSAASASAMASGEKTHFEAVGVFPGTSKDDEEDTDNQLTTVIDVAQDAGWRTGLVATTSVVDATPAAFAAHRAKRKSKDGIALDLASSGVDVLLGGGLRYFEDRPDGRNLLNDFRNDDYSVAKTKTGLTTIANGSATKVVGLFANKDMPSLEAGRVLTLPVMAERAIQILDKDNDDGFFLMLEGSQIDRESHVVNGSGTVAEVLEFEQAVQVALDYARDRDDTLVIVTADHETGGLALLDPDQSDERVELLGGLEAARELAAFPSANAEPPMESVVRGDGSLTPSESEGSSLVTAYGFLSVASRPSFTGPSFLFRATHSATNVALFAEGPGAKFVTAVRDNADLGKRVHRLVEADGESDSEVEPSTEGAAPENLVIVVADGLGLASLSAAQYARGDTKISRMPNLGMTSTHGANALGNDASGSATTLATASLASRGDVGLEGASGLLAKAEAAGRRTAIVTTADVTDSVVASVYDPGSEEHADALVDFAAGDGIDLIFAGGIDSLEPDDLERWAERGVEVKTTWSGSAPSGSKQTVRLIADGDLPSASERSSSQPSLAAMTKQAIESLQSSGEPYVLVVYANGLGKATADLDRTTSLIDEVAEIDDAVAAALLATGAAGDTAVVVTSLGDSTLSVIDNHYGFHKGHCGVAVRCGGDTEFIDIPLAVDAIHRGEGLDDSELQGDFAPPGIILQYAWLAQRAGSDAASSDPGAANFVPVFASGPGTSHLRGFRLQTELAAILAEWVSPQ